MAMEAHQLDKGLLPDLFEEPLGQERQPRVTVGCMCVDCTLQATVAALVAVSTGAGHCQGTWLMGGMLS